MANIKSSQKRILVAERNNARNKANKTQMKTQIKKFSKAVETGDKKGAEKLLPETYAVIDKTVTKGAIHKNAADRRKSVLAKDLSSMK